MTQPVQRPRVVLADDEPLARAWLRTALSSLECEVVAEVNDGDKAVEVCAKLSPDMVFLDIDMPHKDGLEALTELVASDLPPFVVMVSAHSTFDNVSRAADAGASAFVVKPFTTNKVRDVIAKFRAERISA